MGREFSKVVSLVEKRHFAALPLEHKLFDDSITQSLWKKLPFYTESLSENSERAFTSDAMRYLAWCAEHKYQALPADEFVVRKYLQQMGKTSKPNTVKRHLASINALHRIVGKKEPSKSPVVSNVMSEISDADVDERQAIPLRLTHIKKMQAVADQNIHKDIRDMALIALAHCSLLRGSEICRVKVEDITFGEEGSGTLLIRKLKSRKGSQKLFSVYVSPLAGNWIRRWTSSAKLERSDYLFPSITRHSTVRGSVIQAQDVSRIMKEMGARIGVQGFTSHSCRVGGAQDMIARGVDVSKAMQAGRWKNIETFLKYVRNLSAKESGMAGVYEGD